jgi:P-type Ca2+ transporter type 2C
MDTFAALALATDPPTPAILDRKPAGKKTPLITTNMWKMIIGQAIFQLVVTFILYFAGEQILGYDTTDPQKRKELATMVFNTFVWMQIFNEFNNRRLDNKFNIFSGIQRNYFFIGINCIMVGAQIAIIFFGGAAFSITPIDRVQWAICVVTAALCLPWAILIRLFPDPWFAKLAKIFGGPVAVAYRALGRFFSRVGSKMPKFGKKKETPEENVEESGAITQETLTQRERSGTGGSEKSTASVPEIVVGGAETGKARDLEKGI